MSEHTPGPWTYDSTWALINGPEGQEICAVHAATVGGKETRLNRCTADCNAHLIAAAPELLEACKRLLGRVVSLTAHIESCDLSSVKCLKNLR